MDLRKILQIILPRKWTVLLSGLLFAGLAFCIAEIVPLRYVGAGLLMLDTSKDETLAAAERVTDIDVLLSPSLLAEVAALPDLHQNRDLVPRLQLPWGPLQNLPSSVFGYTISGLWGHGSLVAQSPTITPRGDSDGIVAYLRDHLKITGNIDSRILLIRFAAGNPVLAAAVVNELMARYIALDYRTRWQAITAPNAWLRRQVDQAATDAAAADATALAFRTSPAFLASSQGSAADINLGRRWDLLSAAEQQLFDADVSHGLLRSGFEDNATLSPQVRSLREHEIDMSQKLAAARTAMGEANLGQQELQNQMQALHRQTEAAAGKAIGSAAERAAMAQARVAILQAQVDKASAMAVVAAENQFRLEQLMLSAQRAHLVYDNLLNRLHDSELSANQLTQAQVVSPALVPLVPEKARSLFYAILGFIVGCALTTTFFMQRHLVRAQVESADDLVDVLGLPNLGCLPVIGARRGTLARLTLDHPHGSIAETIRGIRLSLQNREQGSSSKVILVTSAERGEGKTSVAAAIALRAAADGLRILLVEGDLHRPSLASDFKMDHTSSDLEAAVAGKLHRDNVLDIHAETKLHCLFARTAVPNALALLDSHGFRRLIEEGRSFYDLVVIDGPPLLRVPDPLVLSRLADRIIWVVRAERTMLRVVVEALRRLPPDRRALVATVITGARKRMLAGIGFYAGYNGGSQRATLRHESGATWGRLGPR